MTTIKKLREIEPLVHCLTNDVVKNFTANGLLAIGASPIMADNPTEVEDVAKVANAVLINIGTLLPSDVDAMKKAGRVANAYDIPVVLDPVAVAASETRREVSKELLDIIQFSVIKGNAGEMAALVDESIETKGVDSVDPPLETSKKIAEKVAKTYNTIAVITGEQDIISNGKESFINHVTSPLLTKVTGGGCLLGAIIGAALSTNSQHFHTTCQIVQFYTQAATYAASQPTVNGPGTFQMNFLDALSKTEKEFE